MEICRLAVQGSLCWEILQTRERIWETGWFHAFTKFCNSDAYNLATLAAMQACSNQL